MRILVVLFAILVSLLGCSANTGVVGGESSTQEGPVLLDATLSLGIVDGRPKGITDYFFFNDTVNVYTLWQNVKDTDKVTFYFLNPSQDVMDSFLISLLPGEFSTAFVSYVPPQIAEDWEVMIYLDNDFERSLLFTLSSNQGK